MKKISRFERKKKLASFKENMSKFYSKYKIHVGIISVFLLFFVALQVRGFAIELTYEKVTLDNNYSNTTEAYLGNISLDTYSSSYKYNKNLAIQQNYTSIGLPKGSNTNSNYSLASNKNTSITVGQMTISEYEYDLLVRIVDCESRGEPYEGKRAVATIILNRVASPKFPNTIEGVIMARNQFTPVSTGKIYKITPTEEVKNAVNDVLAGYRSFSQEVIFFCAPSISTSNWMVNNRPLHKIIGNHHFFE